MRRQKHGHEPNSAELSSFIDDKTAGVTEITAFAVTGGAVQGKSAA